MASKVEDLIRWEASGGHWRVLHWSTADVTVGLYSCDGGSEMSRLTAPAAELADFLQGRTSSEDVSTDNESADNPSTDNPGTANESTANESGADQNGEGPPIRWGA